MPSPVYISGPAGSGKTTKLLAETATGAAKLISSEGQQILAMTYMHGARRRLDASLASPQACARWARKVITIDGFSLDLVNRWRTGLGIKWPIVPRALQSGESVTEKHFRTHMDFEQVNKHAAQLLRSRSVSGLIGASYPIVVVDEFQDCAGSKLEVVQALSSFSQVVIAADHFQLLDDVDGCPAVEWLDGLKPEECDQHRLDTCHRTTQLAILNSARALRENSRATGQTVPIFFGRPAQIVYKIMAHLALGWWGNAKWTGQTALLSPTNKALHDVRLELDKQCDKKSVKRIYWDHQSSADYERDGLFKELGLTGDLASPYTPPKDQALSAHGKEVLAQAQRFARLRGMSAVSEHLVSHFAESALQTSRAYRVNSYSRIATTIHGAKNREFDNVIVVWPYESSGSPEKRRRLLYNAITRAKTNCIVLDLRRKDAVEKDEVMQLLGAAQPVFQNKKKGAGKGK